MSKTSEVKNIFIDLDDTIRGIDPVIADKVKEAGKKVLEIVYFLEVKPPLIAQTAFLISMANDESVTKKIKEIFFDLEKINENN